MGLETGTFLDDLNSAWPAGPDGMNNQDNHTRLIKAVLKATFPGAGGQGFAQAITATEVEINYLSGVTGNIQAQIDALSGVLEAPAGTAMLFYQAAPPTGWTQVTTDAATNRMLRVVNDGTGGAGGGSDSPLSLNWSHTHTTSGHALVAAEIPDISGLFRINMDAASQSDSHNFTGAVARGRSDSGTLQSAPISAVAGMNGAAHSHGNTGSAGSTWAPRYANMIIATKD